MLVTTAEEQHERLAVRTDAGERALWGRGDRVVDVSHAGEVVEWLQAMHDTSEDADRLGDGPVAHAEFGGERDGGEDVVHVVVAAQRDLVALDDRHAGLTVLPHDATSAQRRAVAVELALGRGGSDARRSLGSEARANLVVDVQHDEVVACLELEDASLQGDIIRPGVSIEVVWRDVGDTGDVRAHLEALELRVRELNHHLRPRLNLLEEREQADADVAADDIIRAINIQHRAQQRGGCRLARGACHARDRGRTAIEEEARHRGEWRADRPRVLEHRQARRNALSEKAGGYILAVRLAVGAE